MFQVPVFLHKSGHAARQGKSSKSKPAQFKKDLPIDDPREAAADFEKEVESFQLKRMT